MPKSFERVFSGEDQGFASRRAVDGNVAGPRGPGEGASNAKQGVAKLPKPQSTSGSLPADSCKQLEQHFRKLMSRFSTNNGSTTVRSERRPQLLRRACRTAKPVVPLAARCSFDVIAEIKNRSPAEGAVAAVGQQPSEAYRHSVIRPGRSCSDFGTNRTQPVHAGSMQHLAEVMSRLCRTHPSCVRTFVVEPVQVVEAQRRAGASGVLAHSVHAVSDAKLARYARVCV